jgi:hypothetical protein
MRRVKRDFRNSFFQSIGCFGSVTNGPIVPGFQLAILGKITEV